MGSTSNLKPFKPGQSGNPKGRPAGSRNKLGEDFIAALNEDFQAHGRAAIQKVRDEKPDQYLKVIASIVPKDLNVNVNNFDGMSDDELRAELRGLAASLAAFVGDDQSGGDYEGIGPAQTH
ncbi:MAG: hypothetical protein EOO81_06160 [Oxalobacteraceae bacterium]|nr:MAG: hypothetical protein EOO81_06160 [Oxalobacteraceae bacterium]